MFKHRYIASKAGFVFVILFSGMIFNSSAQTDTSKNYKPGYLNQTDFSDVKARLFGNETKPDTTSFSKLRKLFIPSVSVNPTSGVEFGLQLAVLKFFGRPDSTSLSTGSLELSVATKGLAYIAYKHSVYFPKNRWSLQGNWQIGRTQINDYGLGTGHRINNTNYVANGLSEDGIYKLKFTSFRFKEIAYKKITGKFYGGAGVILNAYSGIDEDNKDNVNTYHYQYTSSMGIPLFHYLANSFSVNLQYDTRDHPNQPFSGVFADLAVRSYKKVIGSSTNATQLITEFRKYWSLSASTPQHVLAFWHWGSYSLAGRLPYLELPGTFTDNNQRSGRAYTAGRFRGESFFYAETEYRFPILRNKFISGVTFVNMQTASSDAGPKMVKIFQAWEPGAGIGLRILYNKYTRSNICIDYGVGNYGAKGLFINLNEAF